MSEFDPESFEKELARLKPAQPPEALLNKMAQSAGRGVESDGWAGTFVRPGHWWTWLRWAVPASAGLAILVGVVAHRPEKALPESRGIAPGLAAKPLIKDDNIEIDQQLIATFDAVGQLPDGEPVRLRCQQWVDGVTLRDSARGVVIERQVPRFEIVPVRFE